MVPVAAVAGHGDTYKLPNISSMKNQSRQENIIYLVVWGMLFAAPLLSLYIRTVSDSGTTFNWAEVFIVWRKFAIYFILFVVHNFLLAPLLVHHQRRVLYFSIVGVVMAVFITYQCTHRPDMAKRGPLGHRPPQMEQVEQRPPAFEKQSPPEFDNQPPPELDNRHRPEFHHDVPPPIISEHDILAIVVLILMFGANLGLKLYFRSRNDHKKLLELEKQNLEQQLEYLKYQINPHFFMNTLNNIHALVDIDPAKAQETILELSKMMRFVLYEGNKHGVSLTREFEFIRTYIKLMQLRYTDKVIISLLLPTEPPDKSIPPLMLISFIENAFKHGVSYKHESFIDVKADIIDEQLHFQCKNSKADKPNEEKGGVGLANVQQRLDLLYDSRYQLKIEDTPTQYNVELILPLS